MTLIEKRYARRLRERQHRDARTAATNDLTRERLKRIGHANEDICIVDRPRRRRLQREGMRRCRAFDDERRRTDAAMICDDERMNGLYRDDHLRRPAVACAIEKRATVRRAATARPAHVRSSKYLVLE